MFEKKIKCGVCGNRFVPSKNNTYRCIEKILMVPDKVIDAIDCPLCGCQNRLAERLMRVPNNRNPHGRIEAPTIN